MGKTNTYFEITKLPLGKIAGMHYKFLEARKDVLGGKMCVKGTRISANLILEWLASGSTAKEIISTYAHISEDAIKEVLQFAEIISFPRNQMFFHLLIK